MDISIEQDDLNQKFLSCLVPEWLVYTIVWRNRDDLDTMSQDDVYNHLKVCEPEVQKNAGVNYQNMAFISSSNTNSGKSEVPTVQGVSTTTTQPNGSKIKYEDITQIDDDDIKEMDIKSPRSQDRGKKEIYKKDPRVEKPAPKAIIAIDGIGWDWSYMAEEDENHALVADEEEVPTEYALMAKSSSSSDNEYSALPPPPAQVYSPLKKDLSWMGLPEFVDDIVTDYSRPTPSVDVSKDVSASSLEQGGSFDNVVSKPMIRFVKEIGCPSVSKDNNTKNPRKPTVKYAEMYRNTSQSPKVRSNNFGPLIIEDWDSDDESEIESTPNKTDRPSIE
ncbi:hypothetical protein Tco_0180532 [Tanacetum coccineum]